MTHLLPILYWSASLPAQTDYARRVQGLQGAFRQTSDQPTGMRSLYLFLAILMTLLILLVVVRNLQQRSTSQPSPRKPYALFTFMLRRLDIGLADRFLLRFAARKCGLRQPTAMLLHPTLFQSSVGRWADSLTFAPFRDYARQRLAVVAARAFE